MHSRLFKCTHPDKLLHQLIEKIVQDESRHVTFGVHYLEQHVKRLSEEEIDERAEFAYEACYNATTFPSSGDL